MFKGSCLKLYRTWIIREYNIRFLDNIVVGEDQMFNMEYYRYVRTFAFSFEHLYLYRRHVSSLTNQVSVTNYERNLTVLKAWNSYVRELLIKDAK